MLDIIKTVLWILFLLLLGFIAFIVISEEISYRKLVREANEKERQRKQALHEAEQKQEEENSERDKD